MSSGKVGMVFTSRNGIVPRAPVQAQALQTQALQTRQQQTQAQQQPPPAPAARRMTRPMTSMNAVIQRSASNCSSCGN